MITETFDSTWHVAVRFALSALAVYRVSFLVARGRRAVGCAPAVAIGGEGDAGWAPRGLHQLPQHVDRAAVGLVRRDFLGRAGSRMVGAVGRRGPSGSCDQGSICI